MTEEEYYKENKICCAYRNYYDAPPEGDKFLDSLCSFICSRKECGDEGVLYKLTEEGIDWLGRMLNITIKRG